MAKLTDEQIENATTKRTMIVKIGYEDWAMSQEDAMSLLGIFTRARRVEQVNSSNFRKTVWIEHEEQIAPIEGAIIGAVHVSEPVANVDQFSAATRAVS